MVQLPIFDADGYPIQKRGITEYPGLYFVGLPWLHNAKSGLLFGLAQDASYIARAINEDACRRPGTKPSAKQLSSGPKSNPDSLAKSLLSVMKQAPRAA